MTIKIPAETEQGTEEIILNNDHLNNDNYIDLVVDGKEYTIHLESLYQSIKGFRGLKEDIKFVKR